MTFPEPQNCYMPAVEESLVKTVSSAAEREPFHWVIYLIPFPVLVYAVFIYLYGSPGPLYEDFEGLGFLIDFNDADSLLAKLKTLLVQATDHRPMTGALTLLLQYKVLGHASFLGLVYLGNLLVLGIALLHISHFRDSKSFILISLVVSWLVFQLIPIGHMLWAGAAISGNYVFLFAYLSLIFLCRQTVPSTIAAIAFAVLAIFSLSNGLALLPAALFLLMMCDKEGSAGTATGSTYTSLNRRYLVKQLIFFEAAGLLTAYVYFSGYTQNNAVGTLLGQLASPDVQKIVSDVVRLLGAGFTYGNVNLQYLSGTMVIVLCFGLFLKQYYKRQPALAVYTIFLMGTVLAICLGRTSWWLLDKDANQSRYFFFSMHIWVILIICYMDLYLPVVIEKARAFVWLGVLVLIVSFFGSYAMNMDRAVEFCWNKKQYNQAQVVKVNKIDKIKLTGGRMGATYDYFAKVAIERGYYNTDRLFGDKPPLFLSDKLACYVNREE